MLRGFLGTHCFDTLFTGSNCVLGQTLSPAWKKKIIFHLKIKSLFTNFGHFLRSCQSPKEKKLLLMAKNLHWLVVNHLFWSDFEQLDWCLWKQLICTKFQQFWGNWPSSFAPYSHIFMMIPNIMGHLPLTEHIKAFSICFQLLGQQFDFSVFCSNSLAYGIVRRFTTSMLFLTSNIVFILVFFTMNS